MLLLFIIITIYKKKRKVKFFEFLNASWLWRKYLTRTVIHEVDQIVVTKFFENLWMKICKKIIHIFSLYVILISHTFRLPSSK